VNLGGPRNGLRISKGNYKSGAWLPDMLSFILYMMLDIIKMFTVARISVTCQSTSMIPQEMTHLINGLNQRRKPWRAEGKEDAIVWNCS